MPTARSGACANAAEQASDIVDRAISGRREDVSMFTMVFLGNLTFRRAMYEASSASGDGKAVLAAPNALRALRRYETEIIALLTLCVKNLTPLRKGGA